jgi:hypothetical protein
MLRNFFEFFAEHFVGCLGHLSFIAAGQNSIKIRFRGLAQYEDYERDEERKARGRDLPVTDMRSPNYDYKVGD